MRKTRKPVGPQQHANAYGVPYHVYFVTDDDGNRLQTFYAPAEIAAARAARYPRGLTATHVATYNPERDGNRYRI